MEAIKTRVDVASLARDVKSQLTMFAIYHKSGVNTDMVDAFVMASAPMIERITSTDDYVEVTWEMEHFLRKKHVVSRVTVVWNPYRGAHISSVQRRDIGPIASLFQRINGKVRRLMKIDASGVMKVYSNKRAQG